MIDRSTNIQAALRSRQRGFLLNPFRFGGGGGGDGDPYFSNVKLLLHMDGANGSTTFTDSSGTPKTVTPVGGAQISTDQSKFGGASCLFNGSGAKLSAGASDDLVFPGDFTIEAFFRSNSSAANASIFSVNIGGGSGGFELYCRRGSANTLQFQYFNGSAYPILTPGYPNFNDSVWRHVAVCRAATTLRLFVGGVKLVEGSVGITIGVAGQPLIIGGSNYASNPFSGHIDEVRVTKGVARYTANFTPPTAPFPNS